MRETNARGKVTVSLLMGTDAQIGHTYYVAIKCFSIRI